MSSVAKTLPEASKEKLSVYSFNGSIVLPTRHGQYWVTAVGGRVESRPVGNPHVLFAIRYIWDLSGQVFEFPEPILWRLNTTVVAGEAFDFEFPAPEASVEELAQDDRPLVGADKDDEGEEGDEEGDEEDIDEFDEDDIDEDDEIEADVEDEDLAEATHAEDELSWN